VRGVVVVSRPFASAPALAVALLLPLSSTLGCNLIFGQSDLEVVEDGSGGSPGATTATTTGATTTATTGASTASATVASSSSSGGEGGEGGGDAATTSSTGGGEGGGGGGCGEDEQDNDGDGTCAPACTADTCSGHGGCDDGSGVALCDCALGFAGDDCGTCEVGYEGEDCAACADGFQDRDDDGTCLPGCEVDACDNGGSCDDATGEVVCLCRPGFEGVDCGTACPADLAGPACDYRIVYGLDLPATDLDWNVPADVPYDVDETADVAAFDRIAYRLILDDEEVWVEMDAFTDDPTMIGVPIDWTWDVSITGGLVISFAANQPQVKSPLAGNVEMWSHCYSAGLNAVYDYDDDIGGVDCYGSLQVFLEQEAVIAFNRFSQGGGNFDLGLGPSSGANPDWTFAGNSATFTTRRLEVYVREE
jgi:hypothetical protein